MRQKCTRQIIIIIILPARFFLSPSLSSTVSFKLNKYLITCRFYNFRPASGVARVRDEPIVRPIKPNRKLEHEERARAQRETLNDEYRVYHALDSVMHHQQQPRLQQSRTWYMRPRVNGESQRIKIEINNGILGAMFINVIFSLLRTPRPG